MVLLNICPNDNGDYTVSDDPMPVPMCDERLVIGAPPGGCTICVEPPLDELTNPVQVKDLLFIDFTGYPTDTSWTYHIYPYNTKKCPKEGMKTAAHAIQIGN